MIPVLYLIKMKSLVKLSYQFLSVSYSLLKNYLFYCFLFTLTLSLLIILNTPIDTNTMHCLIALLCVLNLL